MLRRVLFAVWFAVMVLVLLMPERLFSQDVSTGSLRVEVQDASGARIAKANVLVIHEETGLRRAVETDEDGRCRASVLVPGSYRVRIESQGMAPVEVSSVVVELGAETDLQLTMRVAGTHEAVTVSDTAPEVKTRSGENAEVVDQKSIAELPLNGRRFSDLALLVPGVVADPRGMTSASNGDLSSGGIRGFQSSYLVDGADNNNSFFAQARGRYRAPYQFSNEVVQEFRVNTNNYGAELGRAGAAVVNVVTKSGSNELHGKLFYFLRDSTFGAKPAFLDFKPEDQQHQFGVTVGGPIRKNRAFFFAGLDQHIFKVPSVVRFGTGTASVVPGVGDYEVSDRDLVFLASDALNKMAGNFESRLIGNAGFGKLDLVLSPTNLLSARVSTSRYYGDNNVFFDPASPVTNYAITENGEEDVSTVSAVASLTSGITRAITNSLRFQYSRDWQASTPNASFARTQIDGVIEGFGRSLILPRNTHESKLHLADSISVDGRNHSWKFGGDFVRTKIYNYFPLQFGGGYIFDTIRVNPFTFAPETYGLHLSPLRAYAHMVPRYYMQNFGDSESHPDTNEYALFAQDSMRIGPVGITFGVRYDRQRFRSDRLKQSPLWPGAGRVPSDGNNIAPRIGFAYALGDDRPLMFRGGWGVFYTRIPSIYTSSVETQNGLSRTHLFLDNADFYDRQVFPVYPNPIAECPLGVKTCAPPESIAGNMTSEVSAFGNGFQTPFVQQATISMEREVVDKVYVSGSYLYTHGEHLIRARDVNLPAPVRVSYPVFDEDGTEFLGAYYDVDSFTTWEFAKTSTCTFPPCAGRLQRPVSQLGAINVFESAATSIYHGATISVKRRMSKGLFFRVAYTWGQAIDDGQDALAAGRPAVVQNSYATKSERGWSSVDQRQRWVGAWTWQPRVSKGNRFKVFVNNWKLSNMFTYGSGRPVNARIVGDANRDGNTSNDRLPGYSRNSFLGPDYMTSDFRVSRTFRFSERAKVELLAEFFNMFNRDNKRVELSDDGFDNSAASFVPEDTVVNAKHFPAQYRKLDGFLVPKNAYAPRQVQFAVRFYY
ncbi:MAG TPA: TonB-dependent receptor [Terriglobales bacterium]|nr:TonB-dependent receptor [Terriglobales bacterium]